MSGSRVSRGHPLVALVAVLAGWVGGRAANWEMPVASSLSASAMASDAMPGYGFAFDPRGGPLSFPDGAFGSAAGFPPAPGLGQLPYFRYPAMLQAPPVRGWSQPSPAAWPLGKYQDYPAHLRDDFDLSEAAPRFFAPERAGMSPAPADAPSDAAAAVPVRPKRWSVDAWALLRRDSAEGVASPGALPATYGASQAGAVLRYRLALASAYRPAIYLRTSSSMGQLRETSAALGLSARPLPSLPAYAAIEARLTEQGGRRRFQPAVMAVTELPPFSLPAGFRGEAYAQGGYVAGKFATPFADGQVKADRRLFAFGRIETRLGAGMWGGAQKGAARLDAGPSASLALPLGRGMTGRVALDWRFRIAGDAVPESGPALTLSTGF